MPEQLRISGKDLGALALPDFCPRCFWIKRRAPDGLPFQIFPGIFSSIDAYSKRIVHGWFDRYGSPPAWLQELEVTGYRDPPHHSKFKLVHAETEILLTGSPDGVLVRANRSHMIVDYKTAKFTAAHDALLPVYETQLNAYAVIGEACGFAPVSALALLYTEPLTDDEAAAADHHHLPTGFAMSFVAKILPVELRPASIAPLLRRVRAILDLNEPPAGRSGCKDCLKLEGLLSVLRR